jgi:dihydrofolate synthase/folylpolyglutamate synthase
MRAEDFIYASYMEALPHLHSKKRDQEVRKPELGRKLLRDLGSPEKGLPIILVSGSKGKGSVSRMISFLLEGMGYRTGHFSSPHLLDFTERIRVNGKAISHKDLDRLTAMVKPVVERIPVHPLKGEYISPIAISQAIAMLYFMEQQVDVAVVECGRGGRFDDTNVLPHQVAVITPIMEEHLEQLGPTLEDIVWHKLGIICDGVEHAWIAKQREDVQEIILSQIREEQYKGCNIHFFGQDFLLLERYTSLSGTMAQVKALDYNYPPVMIPLMGDFQAENLSLALAVVDAWSNGKARTIDWEERLQHLRWPGRCEMIGRNPLIILDGGIHRSSALQVRNLVTELPYSKLHVVLSIPRDKDVDGVIGIWSEVADEIITTESSNPYLDYNMDYMKVLQQHFPTGQHISDPSKAIEAGKTGLDQDGILVLMGTQSFVADVKRMWKEDIRDL